MLILTRKVGEVIRIGEDVTITVLGHQKGQVRLGVTAPPEVSVHRSEIYDKIQLQDSAKAFADSEKAREQEAMLKAKKK